MRLGHRSLPLLALLDTPHLRKYGNLMTDPATPALSSVDEAITRRGCSAQYAHASRQRHGASVPATQQAVTQLHTPHAAWTLEPWGGMLIVQPRVRRAPPPWPGWGCRIPCRDLRGITQKQRDQEIIMPFSAVHEYDHGCVAQRIYNDRLTIHTASTTHPPHTSTVGRNKPMPRSSRAQRLHQRDPTLLHCAADYPTARRDSPQDRLPSHRTWSSIG